MSDPNSRENKTPHKMQRLAWTKAKYGVIIAIIIFIIVNLIDKDISQSYLNVGLVYVDNHIIQVGLTLLLMVWQLVYLTYFMMLIITNNMLRMLGYTIKQMRTFKNI